jgi:biotin carboxylase
MPYCTQKERHFLDQRAAEFYPVTAGQLTYTLTKDVHRYLLAASKLNYDAIHSAIGILECAKLELYRVVAAPYEDTKRKENGSVSELDRSLKNG